MTKLFTTKNVIALIFILVIAFIYFFSFNFIDNKAGDFFTKIHANLFNKSSSDKVVLEIKFLGPGKEISFLIFLIILNLCQVQKL